MKTRAELIQTVIDAIKAKSYLEVGLCTGDTWRQIVAPYKVSVDTNPSCGATHTMTSDEFFKMNKSEFDVIFIDAYHEKTQVLKDINNALLCLSPGGAIVTHDTLPNLKICIDPTLCWNAWEAFAELRHTNPNIYMASIPFTVEGVGCGVIRHGTQKLFALDIPYTYENYELHQKEWMNVITPDELLNELHRCNA